MPDITPMNLPKFPPMPPSNQEKTDKIYWRYKKKTPPKEEKAKDPTIFSEDYDNRQHIRSIMREQ